MDWLSECAAMLADIRGEVSAMKRVLAEILCEVRVFRSPNSTRKKEIALLFGTQHDDLPIKL